MELNKVVTARGKGLNFGPKGSNHCGMLLCPKEECGPSRPLQLAGVKFEDIVKVCF
jgi:hypothetical protein